MMFIKSQTILILGSLRGLLILKAMRLDAEVPVCPVEEGHLKDISNLSSNNRT